MIAQFAPVVSQRSHAYANVMGVSPLQLPLVAVSDWPICAVPDTVGGEVLDGATVERESPARDGAAPRASASAETRRSLFMPPNYGARREAPVGPAQDLRAAYASRLYKRSISSGIASSRSVIARRRYSRKCSGSTSSAAASVFTTSFEGTGRFPCTRWLR